MWFNSKQRAEPYLGLKSPDRLQNRFPLRRQGDRCCMAVVSSCREMLGLSPATSATPIVSCHHSVGHSSETAGVKPEEGGDDVKSSWPLCPGLHTCYNGKYKGQRPREWKRIPKSLPQYGLESATRLHEVGIASNRGSARRGEYVPGPCTHRPSHHGS